MQLWRVSLRRGTLLPTLALVASLGACNPFAGLENMEGCGLDARDTALQPGDDEKLAPTLATLTSMHVGSLSWTMTGNKTRSLKSRRSFSLWARAPQHRSARSSEVEDRNLCVCRRQESSNVVGVVADNVGCLPDRQLDDRCVDDVPSACLAEQ